MTACAKKCGRQAARGRRGMCLGCYHKDRRAGVKGTPRTTMGEGAGRLGVAFPEPLLARLNALPEGQRAGFVREAVREKLDRMSVSER